MTVKHLVLVLWQTRAYCILLMSFVFEEQSSTVSSHGRAGTLPMTTNLYYNSHDLAQLCQAPPATLDPFQDRSTWPASTEDSGH